MVFSTPGSSKYERLPMRLRLKLFWISIGLVGVGYEMNKLLVHRIFDKRTEQHFLLVDEATDGDIPQEAIDELHRKREMREAMSLSNILNTPMPNEVSHALQHEYDPRRMAALKSDNGN